MLLDDLNVPQMAGATWQVPSALWALTLFSTQTTCFMVMSQGPLMICGILAFPYYAGVYNWSQRFMARDR